MVCNVVKVGGAVLEDGELRKKLLERFAALGGKKILVHGGGRSATRIAFALGMETEMVGGRRVTDAGMREVVTMVYGGLVNKETVAALQGLGTGAIGLTGADMSLIISRKRPPVEVEGRIVDFGYVGDVVSVDAGAIDKLLRWGKVPVIAPLSYDPQWGLLNTNADTMASEVAASLSGIYEVSLTFCFEKEGVLGPDGKAFAEIGPELCAKLKSEGTVSGGMIPKIDNAFAALGRGVKEVRITDVEHLSGGTLIHG